MKPLSTSVRPADGFRPRRAISQAGTRLALALAPIAFGGCAIKYQDAAGRMHIVGLSAVTITPAAPGTLNVAQVEAQNVGVMIYATAASRGVSVGYNREGVVYENMALPPADQ